ncbi:putative ribosome biogenesis protein RLP24 [Nymphon striatum]|nr:putative ribosome biogenesis protein RLP24 [Nymphon striatum]
MRVEKCYFCSSPLYPGHGILFVRNDCKEFKFCRSKCHKNFKMKRNPRKSRWTKAFRKASGKELTVDPSFEFEKRRNIPVKYDRNLIRNTVGIMKTVHVIKLKREAQHINNRLKKGKILRKEQDLKEVQRDISLIKSAVSGKAKKKEASIIEVVEESVQEMEEN